MTSNGRFTYEVVNGVPAVAAPELRQAVPVGGVPRVFEISGPYCDPQLVSRGQMQPGLARENGPGFPLELLV